ncbi:MAG: DUF308 domain-containing protein [Spirochaetaceae bacterium]|nr:DUF308 domain-containing protein [Spirochaetaceae bacterium]
MNTVDRSSREHGSHGWWAHLLWGISVVVLGVLLIARPVGKAVFLVQVMAVFWLVGGAIDVIHAMVARDKGWGWSLIGGVIGMLAGFVILGHPIVGAVLTVATLFLVAAFAAIVTGVMNMLGGSPRAKKRSGASWSLGRFFRGLLQVVIGVFMLWHPILGTLTFSTALGLVAIVGGAAATALALRARSRKDRRGT